MSFYLYSQPNRILFSLGLLSAAMIAYQLSIMQYLSIIQWYHFAYMVIAIALLGFGGAGSFLALKRNWLLNNFTCILPALFFLSAIFMPLSNWLSTLPFASFDTYLLFVEQKEVWKLLVFELLFFIPFFLCALAIGLIFTKDTSRIGQLYFSNLIGSGLGGILALILFWIAMPEEIPFFTAILAVTGGILIVPIQNRITWLGTGSLLIIILIYLVFHTPFSLEISQYKGLKRSLDLPETHIETAQNSPHGLVQYVSSSVLRYGPGLSLSFEGEIPVIDAVFNNANWAGPVLKNPEDSQVLDFTATRLAFQLNDAEKVLLLDAGTGILAPYYIGKGVKEVTLVESNPLISQFSFSAYTSDKIRAVNKDSRAFLAETSRKFDIIHLPDIGSFGGNAGLGAVQENYLLTLEGLSLCFQKLNDMGVMSIQVWLDYPYRNPLKITALLTKLLTKFAGQEPEQHLTAVRNWNSITYHLHKNPIGDLQVSQIRAFCESMSFDPLILPQIGTYERTYYNALQDESLIQMTDAILSGGEDKLYEEYDFNILPPTDDSPYFFQSIKWTSFFKLQEVFGNQSASFFELGYLVILITLLQSVVLSFFLIMLPLFFLKRKFHRKAWTITYFTGLGIGFMFVEIVFIQRFILLLGNPVYSVASVISILLLMSGLGSLVSGKLAHSFSAIRKVILAIILILLLYLLLLPVFLELGSGLTFTGKVLLSLLLIGFPGFFMGIPFPLGLRYLSKKNSPSVPWAWGINGCISVISTSLASIIAIEAGFSILLLLAVGAYLLSLSGCLNWKMS